MANEKTGIEEISKPLNYFWKILQMACVVLLIIDCFARFKEHKLNWMPIARFIMVTYFTAGVAVIGSEYENAFRGFNEPFLTDFVQSIYHGYFGADHIGIFRAVKNSEGNEYPGYQQFLNVVFIELILYWILWILNKIMLGSAKKGSKAANLICSIYWATFPYFSFMLLYWASMWILQHRLIGQANKNDDATYKRKTWGFVITWIVTFLTILMIFYDGLIDILMFITEYKNGTFRHEKQKIYEETKREEDNDTLSKKSRTSFKHAIRKSQN
jgi:hypothetical protein